MVEKKRLSLCMITKNDEKYITDCLQDLKAIVDEIIIVDIGSDDHTIEKAEQAGAKVYQMQWKNNYSEAKNLCLDYAEGRWVLFLNANESISEEQLKELELIMDNPNVEGYLMYTCHSPNDTRLFYPAQSLRLFRNRREYRYQYKAFERIPDDILSNIEDSFIQIIKRDDDTPYKEKDSDTLLLEEDFIEHPEDSFLQYMYGIVLLNRQMYQESTVCFQNALRNVNFDYLFVPHLFKCLSWTLIYHQRYTEAMAVLSEGIKEFPFYSDLLVLRGELYGELKQYREAIRDLEGSLRIRVRPNLTVTVQEIDTLIILEILGEVHEQVGNYRQALACYRQAYELDNTNQELSDKIAELVQKLE